MIICQYDISKIDVSTVNDVIKCINEKIEDKESIIVIPSGISIAEFSSDEYGIEVIEQVYEFLGNTIKSLKTT